MGHYGHATMLNTQLDANGQTSTGRGQIDVVLHGVENADGQYGSMVGQMLTGGVLHGGANADSMDSRLANPGRQWVPWCKFGH